MELFKILGTIALSGLDKFSADIDAASGKGGELANKISSGLQTASKVGVAALTVASTGIAALTKTSVDNYAEYEQLVGGVETLFKGSADTVMNYADNAYKTAGLSANDYMSTVTSFSASLLQGLGGDTAAAAELANLAITDMSDNANKMGSDMATLQAAYQGFAKQNYTLLDNLKIGYGGTASEMARLINDSGVLGSTIKVTAETVNSVSFAKIIEAIHKVQTQMGITGTTAKEAASTISGSVASMKAAWTNLTTGLANENKDISKLIDEFTETVGTSVENILPKIETSLSNIGVLVEECSPIILEATATLINDVAPNLIELGGKIIDSLVDGIAGNIGKVNPSLQPVGDAIVSLKDTFIDFASSILPPLSEAFSFLAENFDTVITVVGTFLAVFGTVRTVLAITATVESVTTAISALSAGVGIATKMMTGLNAVMAAHSFGAVATAIGILVSGFVILSSTMDETSGTAKYLNDRQQDLVESAEDAAEKYEDLKTKVNEVTAAETAEVEYIKNSLLPELEGLRDEQGRLSQADKDRADFIIGELNDALGTEYESIDQLIDANGRLKDGILAVIAAKEAQILLEAHEEQYVTAVQNRAEAEQARAELYIALQKAEQEALETKIALQERYNELQAQGYTDAEIGRDALIQQLAKEADAARANLQTVQAAYDSANATVNQYYADISKYQTASAELQKGHTEEAVRLLNELGGAYTTAASVAGLAAEEQKAILQDQVQATATNAKLMREAYEQGVEGVTEAMVKTAEETAAAALDEYISIGGGIADCIIDGVLTREDILINTIDDVMDHGNEAANKKLAEFEKTGGDIIARVNDGILSKEDSLIQAVDVTLASGETAAKGKVKDFESIGADIAAGIAKGIEVNGGAVTSALTDVVNSAIGAAKTMLEISSPSKVMRDQVGKWMGLGIAEGITDSTDSVVDAQTRQITSVVESAKGFVIDPVSTPVNTFGASQSGGSSAELVTVMYQVLSAINDLNANMGDSMKKALDGTSLTVNKREFGRMVKAVN